MLEERKKILEMLVQGKIDISEAEQLLDAVQAKTEKSSGRDPSSSSKHYPKYLIVTVFESEAGKESVKKVDVRVPLQMLRAGVKLAALIPVVAKNKINEALQEKGMQFDFDSLKPENLAEIIDAMEDMTVDVQDGQEKVKVYCE